jgi:hypothetical protein
VKARQTVFPQRTSIGCLNWRANIKKPGDVYPEKEFHLGQAMLHGINPVIALGDDALS